MTTPASASLLQERLLERAPGASMLWANMTNAPKTLEVFGLRFENTPMDMAAAGLVACARDHRPTRTVFVNAHVVNQMARNPAYANTIATADRRFADGSGMAIAAKMNGTPFLDNLNGTDLFPVLCAEAIKAGVTIFLLGGKEGVAAEAADNLRAFGLGAAIAGVHHGYFTPGDAEETRVIEAINASGATILLAALGVPRQDTWLEANAPRLNAPVLAGVGGLLDFFAGRVSRAPKGLRSIGLEWTWRLIQEPGRMWRRYIIGNTLFLALALGHAVRRNARIIVFQTSAASPKADAVIDHDPASGQRAEI